MLSIGVEDGFAWALVADATTRYVTCCMSCLGNTHTPVFLPTINGNRPFCQKCANIKLGIIPEIKLAVWQEDGF